jgi:hypothetical protein
MISQAPTLSIPCRITPRAWLPGNRAVGPARTPRPHGYHAARVGALDGRPTATLPHPAHATRPQSLCRLASHVAAVRHALSHRLVGPYLDSCGRRAQWSWLSPKAWEPIKGARARRCARVQDPDVHRHHSSPLRPRGELLCPLCFPATQTSRHLR